MPFGRLKCLPPYLRSPPTIGSALQSRWSNRWTFVGTTFAGIVDYCPLAFGRYPSLPTSGEVDCPSRCCSCVGPLQEVASPTRGWGAPPRRPGGGGRGAPPPPPPLLVWREGHPSDGASSTSGRKGSLAG
jgi:hypothetical protein